ncbi:SRPBCC family protein [Sphingobacterium athyrii]|uniref:SRPBCC family protein n=1 Tax=Sphingobacterium athyrii TaxID=2152717 RepID=UPI0028B12164|nr:SRPBCC domain-containing protein [Sphingobacterium athyrii]
MMEKLDFTTEIIVAAKPHEVFDAIKNVRGWWSENIEGSTDTLNEVFAYHYQDIHQCELKITEIQPNVRIVWQVLTNNFKFGVDKQEWVGSHVIFDIIDLGDKTQVKFTHRGLTPDMECYEVCHAAWTYYIHESLNQFIMNGQGLATPKESPIAMPKISEELLPEQAGKSIYHRLLIKVSVEKVYRAITTQEGLAGWWTPDTNAVAAIGSVLRFGFGPDYFKEMEVLALRPYSLVVWKCKAGYEEWIGTTLTFELTPHQKGCTLLFHHDGWANFSGEFASCSYDWALFFRSLKFFCETGKGFPYPDFNV